MKKYLLAYALLVSISFVSVINADIIRVSAVTKNKGVSDACRNACTQYQSAGRKFRYNGDNRPQSKSSVTCMCETTD